MSSLAGDQDTVADPALPSATVTVILNGPMDAVLPPSLAVMVTFAVVPTSLLVGVPVS
jgi:hypothetical protein